jgi:hypothetical protein
MRATNYLIIPGLLISLLMLAGCVTTQPKDISKFRSEDPHSILVVPVVNRSVEVSAADYFLSTISVPLGERGYYVFPVNLVKRVLEDEGLSDASLVHDSSASKLAALFGADAVLYVTIERWDAQYLVLSTTVTVEFSYLIKSGKTDELLWSERRRMVYTPQNSGGGHPLATLIVAAVNAAVTKASPNYMPLSRQANQQVFAYPGPGLPAGPYLLDQYKKD